MSKHLPRPLMAAQQDRRNFRRVQLGLFGRYMLPTREEYPCRVVDMSPGGVRLACDVIGQVGDRVVAYIDQIGRIEGAIARHLHDGFGMTIIAGARKREKIAAQLTWLANRSALGLPEDRRHERVEPLNPATEVLKSDGSLHAAILVDLSQSGAALRCGADVEIGEPIAVGDYRGIVVRRFDNGFAVEFSERLESSVIDDVRQRLAG